MPFLRFVIFKQANYVRFNYENIRIDANKMMVFRDPFEILMDVDRLEIECNMQQLLHACDNLGDYLPGQYSGYDRNSFRMINFPPSAQRALEFLLQSDKGFTIPFIVHYCLSVEWDYYSEMFSSLINEGGELISFMTEYAFNPWPVERYAEMLGLSLRKFNYLFKSRYGISPKQWLRETRLNRASYLLGATLMPVADIASLCGFSNHAYFSEAFRKHYACTPSQWREQQMLAINIEPEVK